MSQISIIMPLYNAEQFLEESVRSVQQQTYSHWELWIIDDHSTDGSAAIALQLAKEDNRIHVIRTVTNTGAAAARNLGVQHAAGQYIAFLDSDDYWRPDKLEKQLNCIHSAGADLCYTSYAMISADSKNSRKDYLVPENVDYEALLRENIIGCSTVLLDADLAKAHPFRQDCFHEDYALWLELLNNGCRAVGCREVLTAWRYHEASRSFNKIKSACNRWRIYRKTLGLSPTQSAECLLHYGVSGLKKYSKR